MAKPIKRPAEEPPRVRIEALARFRHDGAYVEPGAKLLVREIDAEELAAIGFARKVER
jgi:hypothetical protein